MTNIDQFESVFKAADKPMFRPQEVRLARRLVICDAVGEEATKFKEDSRRFLKEESGALDTEGSWQVIGGDEFANVSELLEQVKRFKPDIVITHRNLHVSATEHPYSLGTYLDVLTQAVPHPVLVAPTGDGVKTTPVEQVMALSDVLVSQDRLVSYAAAFTGEAAKLYLAHIEDEAVFDRFMLAIGKIPSIDTDEARQMILERLFQDSTDYIQSCSDVLAENNFAGRIEPVVRTGHQVSLCIEMIAEDEVDLLVLNTKDDEQMAMHGLAYPLAVQVRNIPLLLL